ncbi:MAG TPA: hypothetical protein DD706_24715 [Nitrospiraceae bacterium]|nr:hypothetical protein [Nitrospiraceae bacterium]
MWSAQSECVQRGYRRKSYLNDYGLGTLGQIFDGQPPFASQGGIAQAWTVAEVLRAWHLIQLSTNKETKEKHTPQKKKCSYLH